ncbi:MAG: CorA family divalent cation transporter [Polyangiaceae bacterium]
MLPLRCESGTKPTRERDVSACVDGSSDTEGLICAFRLKSREELALRPTELELSKTEPLWLHFSLSDIRVARYLEQRATLDEDVCRLLVRGEERVRLLRVPGGFALALGDLRHDFDADPEGFGTLRVYVDARAMITCRHQRLTSTDRLRQQLQRGDDACEGTTELFAWLIQELVSGFSRVSSELAETVDDAEDEILAGNFERRAAELGRLRRLLARLRRTVGANRSALSSLPESIPGLYDAEQRRHLKEVIEQFDAVGQDLELVTERARLLQEEIAGRLGEATNRNLYLLSIVTTVLLPITMITGVFGMNVGGLPFSAHNHGFWWVMAVMALAVGSTMWFLRRMRVL